ISVQRDWGWAPEYVEAMYLMLQQPQADDYAIATGETYSLEDFVKTAFDCVGLNWEDFVETDQSLYRPTDIAVGRASPAKAKHKLGWEAQVKMPDIVKMMVQAQQERSP
ncbi:GDP-mannose 4,6-dehydratase, partial [Arthrospira sp. O9.13F]